MRDRFADYVVTAISWLPNRLLHNIEHAARLSQGKGWGVATVRAEVHAALSMLPPDTRDGFLAYDIGANVGSWTKELLLLAPNARIRAFEPSVDAFQGLQSALGTDSRVQVEHFGQEFSFSETVRISTVDEIAASNDECPILLKLDVEGMELAVLAGASQTLHGVKVIQFEFGPPNIDSRTFL